jgi:hypothetical protein
MGEAEAARAQVISTIIPERTQQPYRLKMTRSIGNKYCHNKRTRSFHDRHAGQFNGKRFQTTVTLSWQDNSSNETGFKIERAPKVYKGTPNYQTVGTVGANATGFSETIAAGTYYYRVQATILSPEKYLPPNSVQVRTVRR